MDQCTSRGRDPYGGPKVDEIGEGSPSRVAVASLPRLRPANTVSRKRRSSDQVLLSMYVPPYERIYPLMSMVAPDLEGAREIIYRWSLFNQTEPPVAHMCDLFPNYFRAPVVVCTEKYSISFPIYMNKEAFQSVVEDGMFIRNHDVHRSVELVRGTLLGYYFCLVISF